MVFIFVFKVSGVCSSIAHSQARKIFFLRGRCLKGGDKYNHSSLSVKQSYCGSFYE